MSVDIRRPMGSEALACEAAGRMIEMEVATRRERWWSPEADGDPAPVDRACLIEGRTYAIEHTLIEAYPKQIEGGHDLERVLGPVRDMVGVLPAPGMYDLVIREGVLGRVRRDQIESVRKALADWIRETAPQLTPRPPGNARRACPPGVPFEVTLSRHGHPSRHDGRLALARYAPEDDDREDRRVVRVGTSLQKKARNLRAWSVRNAETVMVVESRDAALTNHVAVAEALEAALPDAPYVPDRIVYVDTTLLPDITAWTMKRGSKLFFDLDERWIDFRADDLAGSAG